MTDSPLESVISTEANSLTVCVAERPPHFASAPAVPRCKHFGTCNGCQLQNVTCETQLEQKRIALAETLLSAGIHDAPHIDVLASPMQYGYRNRVRLRLEKIDGTLRFGYTLPASRQFLAIEECPIAAPLLLETAGALMRAAQTDAIIQRIVAGTAELELVCNANSSQLMMTLLTTQRSTKLRSSDIATALTTLSRQTSQLISLALARIDPHSRAMLQTLAAAGKSGIGYEVPTAAGLDTHWLPRGAFFQVNRALLPAFVDRVTAGRSGALAWDLYAGIGLFSRALMRSFASVTAVEIAPFAFPALAAALAKAGPQYTAHRMTTQQFLERAVFDRDRPDFIVMDPPRAGLGAEVCALLSRLRTPHLACVSCDPHTLAADLARLRSTYRIDTITAVDLFPQTTHIESIVTLSALR